MGNENNKHHESTEHPGEHKGEVAKLPEGAQIKSADDNRKHAQIRRRQDSQSFKITGVNVHTGKKQESFTIVAGETEHKDTRPLREDTNLALPFDLAKVNWKNVGNSAERLSEAVRRFESGLQLAEKQVTQWNPLEQLKSKDSGSGPADVGWVEVNMAKDPPPVNQLLKDKPNDTYNCKYYLKAYIEGKLPNDKDPQSFKINDEYMQKHNFHKQQIHSVQDLKDGDIVMINSKGTNHMDPIMHVAIVQKDAQGHIHLIQKPDDVRSVQRCSLQDFMNHFSNDIPNFKIPGPNIDVYRR